MSVKCRSIVEFDRIAPRPLDCKGGDFVACLGPGPEDVEEDEVSESAASLDISGTSASRLPLGLLRGSNSSSLSRDLCRRGGDLDLSDCCV